MRGDLLIDIAIVLAFLGVNVVFGILGHQHSKTNPDDYFLAGRNVGAVVLFFTLIATNFSAFFFLGFAGAAYRIGYSYYGIMAFGTALVAVAFYFLGYKAWQLGRSFGYITPPEMIGDLLKSRPLKLLYAAVMVVFTVPYLALQPIGAGYLLANLTGEIIPYFGGAVFLTIIIVLYVFVGGMRSVAWTDVFQGCLMFLATLLAVLLIAGEFGGLAQANRELYELDPALFSRQGSGAFFTPRLWFSYMLLWVLCVPMFPQMFMRFFIAKSSRPLQISAVAFPLVTAILFIGPVIIGVLGRLAFPGLEGNASDNILPMMLAEYAPGWLATLIMVGALAAFMSTMDSQLLAMSSILTRDVYLVLFPQRGDETQQFILGRVLVVALAITGLLLAYKPPATIFDIARETFTGLAVLFPTSIAALYWRRTSAASCFASILIGEALVAAFHYNWLPDSLTFGFLPVIPVVFVSSVIIVLGSLLWPSQRTLPGVFERRELVQART